MAPKLTSVHGTHFPSFKGETKTCEASLRMPWQCKIACSVVYGTAFFRHCQHCTAYRIHGIAGFSESVGCVPLSTDYHTPHTTHCFCFHSIQHSMLCIEVSIQHCRSLSFQELFLDFRQFPRQIKGWYLLSFIAGRGFLKKSLSLQES